MSSISNLSILSNFPESTRPFKPKKNCCLPWCPNIRTTMINRDRYPKSKEIYYFPFPVDRAEQIKWIYILRMDMFLNLVSSSTPLTQSYFLCDQHFDSKFILKYVDGSIICNRSGVAFLRPMTIPTTNLEGALYTFYNRDNVMKPVILKRENDVCCCIIHCRMQHCSNYDAEIAMYAFPKDLKLLRMWIYKVNEANQIRSGNANYGEKEPENAWLQKYICSEHFNLEDLSPVVGEFYTMFRLRSNAIPFAADKGPKNLNKSIRNSTEIKPSHKRVLELITLSDSESSKPKFRKFNGDKGTAIKIKVEDEADLSEKLDSLDSSTESTQEISEPETMFLENSNNPIPLITKCFIIDSIKQIHDELCQQFDISRSQVIKIWDNRKSVLSKDALNEI